MIEVGAKPVPMKIGVRRSKVPEAIPSITETKSDPSEPSLTTARSSTPSPLKSPAASAIGKPCGTVSEICDNTWNSPRTSLPRIDTSSLF